MPEVKLPDAAITFDSVLYTLALIVVVAGVITTIVKGWESIKKISVRSRIKSLEGRMAKVEARLQLGDKRFELQSDDMGQTLSTLQALLVHFITGNDHDRLRDQLTGLNTYMTQRATRAVEIANEIDNHQQTERGNHDA